MTDLAKLVVRLEAETAKYHAELARANRSLEKFAGSTSKTLRNWAGAFAGFFSVREIARWGSAVVANAGNLDDLSAKTGIAVEQLSRLQFAARQNGVEQAALETSLRKLNNTLAEAAGNAKSEAATAFRALGVDVRDSAGQVRAADDVLADVATRFAGYADGANKSAIATALFGKTGSDLIPLLNEGADGLARLGDQAARAGAVISTETAAAADEFEKKAGLLKATLVDGLGARIAEQLLPTLNNLADEFLTTAQGGEALDRAATVAANGLRLLISSGLVVAHVFDSLGQGIGAVGAALVAVAQGEFRRAYDIVATAGDDIPDRNAKLWDRIDAVWREGGAQIVDTAKKTAEGVKAQAPSIAGLGDAEKATRAALDKLRDLNAQVSEQVATFGKGEAAALAYRLELGDLADTVKAAGSAGAELVASINAQAAALESLKRQKEVADGLAAVNVELERLRGNAEAASLADFDRQNAELVKALRAEGNAAGLQQVETLRALTAAQERFNALQADGARVRDQLAQTEERIQNALRVGAVTELDALNQTGAARAAAADQLDAILAKQKAIAVEVGNPALIDATQAAATELDTLRSQVDLLGQKIESTFKEGASDALFDFVKGAATAKEAIVDLFNTIADQLLRLATQNVAESIFGGIGGLFGGGGGGGIAGALGSLFGGGRAMGGSVKPGVAYKVNEATPRSEYFVPNVAGTVVPAAAMGGGFNVTQNFAIQAPAGTVSRATQMQVGAAAARGLETARRRNG